MSNGLNNSGRHANGTMDPAGRSPDEIQQEIRETRSQMDSTLDAIQQRLSPSSLTDEMIHYLRNGGANEFAHNLNEAVKRNPVPVTLMGIGLAWMMMSGKEGRYAPDRASSGGSHLGERLSGVASRLGNAASAGRDRLASAASAGRETLSSARERISATGSNLREQVGQSGYSIRDQASSLGDSTRYGAQRARGGFETMMREQPLLLGAIGVAVGAALGSLLPPTRQEDEWMGGTRDRLSEQARETADLQLRKGKRIAQAAGEAAGDAAEREAKRQREESGQSGASRRESSAAQQGAQPAPGL
jgi:ElaB/YqjD/DUF883 family membrane-anchored ribosome-binding protein